MKKTALYAVLTVFCLSALAPQALDARALDRKDKRQIECAMFKMQVLANYFNVNMPQAQKEQ